MWTEITTQNLNEPQAIATHRKTDGGFELATICRIVTWTFFCVMRSAV